MIILLIVKPKRHSAPAAMTLESPALPVEDGTVARPLQEMEPDDSQLGGLESEADGAPFRISR